MTEERVSEEGVVKRRDEALRRAMNTPPTPHVKKSVTKPRVSKKQGDGPGGDRRPVKKP